MELTPKQRELVDLIREDPKSTTPQQRKRFSKLIEDLRQHTYSLKQVVQANAKLGRDTFEDEQEWAQSSSLLSSLENLQETLPVYVWDVTLQITVRGDEHDWADVDEYPKDQVLDVLEGNWSQLPDYLIPFHVDKVLKIEEREAEYE